VGEQAGALDALAADYLGAVMAFNPFEASVNGLREYDALVPDYSADAAAAQRRRLVALAARLAAINPAGLGHQDELTWRTLEVELRGAGADLDAAWPEFNVNAALDGIQTQVITALPKFPVTTPEQAARYLERVAGLGRLMDQAIERLREGAAAGRHPTTRGLTAAVEQLDGYLARDPDSDPLLVNAAEAVRAAGQLDRLRALLDDEVRPALARYRDHLVATAGDTRPDELSGLVNVPGGEKLYRDQVRRHTTTELTPDQVHATGLASVAELLNEVAGLGGKAYGLTDPAAVFERLRTDPAQRFATAAEMMAYNIDALRRADEATPHWFGRLPELPCTVVAMDELEAASGTIGLYQPPRPARDGEAAEPGIYWLNVLDPPSRTRYEYEALTFHEAVPGHHTQVALAQELTELPEFRRIAYVTAYVEGWGLYAERLADEAGLYSGDVERLGMLSFQLWRACRLVVDTGLHALGWSRDRAIGYMRDNTALTEANVVNEVDRYISAPGQATAYMIGFLELTRLRRTAERAMGERFRPSGFHDLVLGSGPLPLSVLAGEVAAWAGLA
jgi:uncharacterized protein (DUF885 family)